MLTTFNTVKEFSNGDGLSFRTVQSVVEAIIETLLQSHYVREVLCGS